MKKIIPFFLFIGIMFALFGCSNSEVNLSDLPTQEQGNDTSPTPEVSLPTDPEPSVPVDTTVLEHISGSIFLNVLDTKKLTLPKQIQGYDLIWDYSSSYFRFETQSLIPIKNGTTTLTAILHEDGVSFQKAFEITISKNQISHIFQQGLHFYYLFISDSKKIGSLFTPSAIVLHNTANSATAKNEVLYLDNPYNTSSTSFHFAVDETGIYQAIPLNRYAHHAGSFDYNRRSIGVEVAKSLIADAYIKDQAIRNSQQLIHLLQHYYNIDMDQLVTHRDVTGKNCPHDILERYGYDKYRNELRTIDFQI